jgi:hypothetical protein
MNGRWLEVHCHGKVHKGARIVSLNVKDMNEHQAAGVVRKSPEHFRVYRPSPVTCLMNTDLTVLQNIGTISNPDTRLNVLPLPPTQVCQNKLLTSMTRTRLPTTHLSRVAPTPTQTSTRTQTRIALGPT